MRSAHRKASGPVVGQLDGQAAGELDHGALAGGVPRPGGGAGQAERARLERTQPFSQRLLRALVVSPEPSYIDSEYQLRQPRAKEQIGRDDQRSSDTRLASVVLRWFGRSVGVWDPA